jgi:hypothetical protein
LSEQQERREKEAKFQFGLKKALRPRWQDMGFESEAEFDNADSRTVLGLAQGAIESQAIAGHEQQRKLQAAQLRQTEQQEGARARFNKGMAQFLNGPFDGQPPMQGNAPRLTPDVMTRLAAESQLPMEDQFRMSAMLENLAQSDAGAMTSQFNEDPITGFRFMERGRQVLPSGVNPEKSGTVGTVFDEQGNRVAGVVRDARGAIRNLPADNAARERKMSIEAVVDAEKALMAIDDEIRVWNNASDKAKTDKSRKAPDAKRLQELERRKSRLEKLLSHADTEESTQDAGEPPTVKSKVEVDKLPSGSEFIFNGKKYRKK